MSKLDDKTINKIIEDTSQDVNAVEPEIVTSNNQDSELLPDSEVNSMIKDVELEKKFGDQEVRAFAEGAARAATFGVSDAVIKRLGLANEQELRERKLRNQKAEIAGQALGIIGPAALSGGTSLAAKGASAGFRAATKAGAATEAVTAGVLKKLIKDTGKSKIAKEVLRKGLTKGAGSAVEGAAFSLGQLVSENELGEADFNAENVISSIKTGALLGGVAGGIFGAAELLVPVVKNNAVQLVNKSIKKTVDPSLNAQQLAGRTPAQISKIKKMNPFVYEKTPQMLQKVAKVKSIRAFDTNTKLFNAVREFSDDAGKSISATLKEIDTIVDDAMLPMETRVSENVINKLDELKKTLGFVDESGQTLRSATAQQGVKKIENAIKFWEDSLASNQTLSATKLNELKQRYQKLARWDRKGQLPLDEQINREISRSLRQDTLDFADSLGGSLGPKLRESLEDFGLSQEFLASFGKKIDSQSAKEYLGVRDLLLGGAADAFLAPGTAAAIVGTKKFLQSDFRRKLSIFSNIERANNQVQKKIKNSVKNFTLSPKRVAPPLTTKMLLNHPLAKEKTESGNIRSPKNVTQAFKNLQTNLIDLQDQDALVQTSRIQNIETTAPNTHAMATAVLSSAASFLLHKLPKKTVSGALPMLTKDYTPTSQEVSKFNRYLQAINDPTSVLDDLEQGKVSREAIEAIKVVFPNMYQRIQEEVLLQVSENPDKISYDKRLQLGIVLNIPTDAALNPENIAALQAHFKETEEVQLGGSDTISASKASNIDIAESRMSETEKVSNKE